MIKKKVAGKIALWGSLLLFAIAVFETRLSRVRDRQFETGAPDREDKAFKMASKERR